MKKKFIPVEIETYDLSRDDIIYMSPVGNFTTSTEYDLESWGTFD